MIILV